MAISPKNRNHISLDGALVLLLIGALGFNLYCILRSFLEPTANG
jgi:hypothetical protein